MFCLTLLFSLPKSNICQTAVFGGLCYYNRVEIRIQKVKAGAVLPSYAHLTDAGADLCSAEMVTIPASVAGSAGRGLVPTGIAMEIPEGYVGLVWDKSGLATKKGITTIAGVIDSGYRGEIAVAVANLTNEPHTFKVGDKVAQILFQPVTQAHFVETDILSEADRGEKGFGSTGR